MEMRLLQYWTCEGHVAARRKLAILKIRFELYHLSSQVLSVVGTDIFRICLLNACTQVIGLGGLAVMRNLRVSSLK